MRTAERRKRDDSTAGARNRRSRAPTKGKTKRTARNGCPTKTHVGSRRGQPRMDVLLIYVGSRAEAQTRGTNWRVGRIIWQGVDHVLRPMRKPAHPWGTILHEVREGGPAGRGGDIFSGDGSKC